MEDMLKNALAAILVSFMAVACQKHTLKSDSIKVSVLSENLKFNEGTVPYGSKLLISNFGTKELNPLGAEGTGYISILNDGKVDVFIGADGHLDSPKGMAIENDKLYIADVGKVVIYDLKDLGSTPIVVAMPSGDLFVNDIAISGEFAFISVTNTGKVYKLNLETNELADFIDVPGANGLLINGKTMYIASYPPDGKTTQQNVIYTVPNIDSPVLSKLMERQGQYDGLALYKSKLYFTSWENGEVGYIDLTSNAIKVLDLGDLKLQGPADISIMGDTLFVPDLVSSKLIKIQLKY